MKSAPVVSGLCFWLGLAAVAFAQQEPGAANAPAVAPAVPNAEEEDSLVVMQWQARVLTGFEYRLEKPAPVQGGFRVEEYGFFVDQARLEMEAELNDRLSAEVSFELADGFNPKISALDINRPQYVRDAFIDARFKREFRARVGHFKRPFSRLENTSSGKLPVRGRGLLNGELISDGRWGDRALGAMLWGKIERPEIDWYFGVMNPDWTPEFRRNGYDLIARVEYEPWRWLSVGANGGRKSIDPGTGVVVGYAGGGDVRLRFLDAEVLIEGNYGDLVFDPELPAAFGALVLATYDIELSPVTVLQPVVFAEYADAHSVFTQSEAARLVVGANVIHHEAFRVMPQVAFTRPVGSVSEFNPWHERYDYFLMLSFQL